MQHRFSISRCRHMFTVAHHDISPSQGVFHTCPHSIGVMEEVFIKYLSPRALSGVSSNAPFKPLTTLLRAPLGPEVGCCCMTAFAAFCDSVFAYIMFGDEKILVLLCFVLFWVPPESIDEFSRALILTGICSPGTERVWLTWSAAYALESFKPPPVLHKSTSNGKRYHSSLQCQHNVLSTP